MKTKELKRFLRTLGYGFLYLSYGVLGFCLLVSLKFLIHIYIPESVRNLGLIIFAVTLLAWLVGCLSGACAEEEDFK